MRRIVPGDQTAIPAWDRTDGAGTRAPAA